MAGEHFRPKFRRFCCIVKFFFFGNYTLLKLFLKGKIGITKPGLSIVVAIFENRNFMRSWEHFLTLNLCWGNTNALFSCLMQSKCKEVSILKSKVVFPLIVTTTVQPGVVSHSSALRGFRGT